MYLLRKSIDVDFSHHVRGHDGPCINLHGHTWKFEVDLVAAELDAQGFVMDFGVLKRQVLKPCHALLDHSLAVGRATYAEIEAELAGVGERLLASRALPQAEQEPGLTELGGAELRFPGGMRVAVFPFAPTSERLARWLYDLAHVRLADDRVGVHAARIYETLHPVHAVAEYVPSLAGSLKR